MKSLKEADFTGKKVLLRLDFNVPLSNGKVLDTFRIDLGLPTILEILEKNPSKLIIMAHLGRPKGQYRKDLSLAPIAEILAEKLQEEVLLTQHCHRGVEGLLPLKEHKIIMLENLRFHPEEEQNGNELAKKLASYGDVYVNDAFGVSHRKHASVHQIINYFPKNAYTGPLIAKEVSSLKYLLDRPERPYVALIGGAKVKDKIGVLERLLPHIDQLLIGGAMAYPFLKHKGYDVGTSLCSEDDVQLAGRILRSPGALQKILLPLDHRGGEDVDVPFRHFERNIPEGVSAFDIGETTLTTYKEILSTAKTLFWNGPMGLFEKDQYAQGTLELAKYISLLDAYTVVGGGDSVSALRKANVIDKISHVSTGGGAGLEFLELGTLPGIQALQFGVSS